MISVLNGSKCYTRLSPSGLKSLTSSTIVRHPGLVRSFTHTNQNSSSFVLHKIGAKLHQKLQQFDVTNGKIPSSINLKVNSQTSRDALEEKNHDKTLRLIFDSDAFWQDFNRNSPNSKKVTGLFDNPYLTSPQGLLNFTQVSLAQAQALAQKILQENESDVSDPGRLIRLLDRLSDTLCQVIDLMGCLQASHANSKYQAAARQSHETMFEFMNILNTSVELYQRLESVFSSPERVAKLTREEKSVGRLLLSDFVKSGIQLNPEAREKFVKLSSLISTNGHEFMTSATAPPTDPKDSFLSVPKSRLEGIDPYLESVLPNASSFNLFKTSSNKNLLLPTTGGEAATALRTVKDEEIRHDIWLQGRKSPDPKQIPRLESILKARQQLAELMGQNSFSGYELQDKMVKTPQNVMKFLNKLASDIYPKAQLEISALAKLKNQAQDIPYKTDSIQPWDRDYFGSLFLHQQHLKTDHRDDTPTKAQVSLLPQYFSLGTVMQGLSRLFSSIYGIKFVPVEPKPGETWRNDIRRLNVVADDGSLIGVMYCDLFQAPGKSPNPAHFTVRCSRKIFAEEDDEVRKMDPLAAVRYTNNGTNKDEQQLPIIVLTCNFSPGYSSESNSSQLNDDRSSRNIPSLLSFTEVETLFHEMGHAMHSMLGQTDLHNVSGTRCATDFVELPSVLMERFASAPQVLSLYSHHYLTGEPLPFRLLQEYQRTTQQLLQYSETYSQIKLAMLDQLFHSGKEQVLSDLAGSYQELEAQNSLFPLTKEYEESLKSDLWFTQFGHLVGYGASYYCYLFDRAIADRVWDHVFKQDPTNRASGEKWKNQVLKWGGSRNPWELVADVLDIPELVNGDEKAIAQLAYSSTEDEVHLPFNEKPNEKDENRIFLGSSKIDDTVSHTAK